MRARFKQSSTVSYSTGHVPGRTPNASKAGFRFKEGNPSILRQKKLRWPIFLFLVGLVWPCVFYIGPLRMSAYRIVLFVMILPCLGMLIAGKAGRIRIADVAVLLFSLWCMLSFTVNSGLASSFQTSGIIFIETVGPYLLARRYIRDSDDFYNVVQLLFRIVAFLLPFAILEFVSGRDVLRELFAAICPTWSMTAAPRLGLTRVQTVFDHPILFGVFTGSIFSLVHLVLGYQKPFFQRALKTGVVGTTTILSLSSGPVIAIVVQCLLLSWNSLLKGIKIRWKILIGLVAWIVLSIEVIANRSLPQLVSSYLAFDQQSYWFRTLIWYYGSASALRHPFFGVGSNAWERPLWMPSSIDNLWLLLAVRNGLPAPFFLLLALLSVFLAVGFKKGLDAKLATYRVAFLISMTALFMVAWTVDFWDATYALFLFLMGSGMWILDAEPKEKRTALGTSSPR